jgi:UDP-N-acetylmuramate dehydrogenase
MLDVLRDVSLHARNTFGIAAQANELAVLKTPGQLASLYAWLNGREPFVLGGGSNILLRGDLSAPVIEVQLRGALVTQEINPSVVLLHAPAGMQWHQLVLESLALGLGGLENLSLIPGTVGASPIQNIGAYGVELQECLDSLVAWNWKTGQTRCFQAKECALAYRDSVFKHAAGKHWIVLSVCFRLTPFQRHQINLGYAELKNLFAQEALGSVSPIHVSQAVIALRQRKLPDPSVLGNAGSFFKNPIVSSAKAAALTQQFDGLPVYRAAAGMEKLSAAWMIDQCGWKGHRTADAGVHHAHALVLVNHGQATGAQIWHLAQEIQNSVAKKFGVTLEPEPILLG